jgi:predicted MFS family arabinose efflux permease
MSDSPSRSIEEPDPADSSTSTRLILAVTATWIVSQLSYYAQPQLLEPIKTRFGQGDEAVGWMYGSELLAFALTALLAAGPLSRLPRLRVAMFGGLMLALANLASGFVALDDSGSFAALQWLRILAGMGGGVLGAAGTASAASSANPQRVYAIVTFASFLLIAAEPPLLPWVVTPWGASGGFFALAATNVLLLPLFGWLLPPRKSDTEDEGSIWASILRAPNRALALAAMAALFIYETGQGGVFMFVAEIGERSGLDEQAVGNVLGGTALAGLMGAAIAAWLGDRIGYRTAIVVGIALNAVAACVLSLSENSTLYLVGNLFWNSAYYFVTPYLMAVMAKLDDLGRWVVAVDAIWWLGDAAGPPIGGMIVERSGYDSLAMFPLVTGVICIAVFIRMLARFDRREVSAAA